MKTEQEIRDALKIAEFELNDDRRVIRNAEEKKYPGYEAEVVSAEGRMQRTTSRIATLRWVLGEEQT